MHIEVYKMLKKRDRKRDVQKWARTRLADFLIYALLIIFSFSCFFLRSELENYLLRWPFASNASCEEARCAERGRGVPLEPDQHGGEEPSDASVGRHL